MENKDYIIINNPFKKWGDLNKKTKALLLTSVAGINFTCIFLEIVFFDSAFLFLFGLSIVLLYSFYRLMLATLD